MNANRYLSSLVGYPLDEGLGYAPEAPTSPMQLAAGGISFQTQRALNQLERELNPRAQGGPSGAGSTGKDDRVTQEWRQRNAPRQEQQLEELLRRRRMLEQQLKAPQAGGDLRGSLSDLLEGTMG